MRLKKYCMAGPLMAVIKRVFDLYPQAGRDDRYAEHLFSLWEPGMAQALSLDGQHDQQAWPCKSSPGQWEPHPGEQWVAGLFFGIVITRSEGLISHSLMWLRKKPEEILLLSIKDRARWKPRPAKGMQLWTTEADTPIILASILESFPPPSRTPWQSDQILHILDKGGSPT